MLFSPCCARFPIEKRRQGASTHEDRPKSRGVLASLFLALLVSGCASMDPSSAPPQQAAEAPHQVRIFSADATPQQPNNYPALPLADASEQPSDTKLVDLTVAPNDVWSRIRLSFAIPNIDTDLVREWENYYSSRPDSFYRIAQRASKYLYHVIEEIDSRGLPSELALLPFVESAYNPLAQSPAKASGLWQFIPSTGRGFNLKQDWWRDERNDPIASTRAAMEYLQYLFDFHGDWHLALASYNWGEGSVKRAIDKREAVGLDSDYLSLEMPNETRNYIPKLQALKNIISDPASFKITLPDIDNQPYFATLTKTRTLDVETAAKLAEMPLDEFRALNPSFKRGVILGRHTPTLLLPTDKIAVFQENLRNYQGALSSWQTHQVGKGESIAAIAKRYGITQSALRTANGLSAKARLQQGQALLIPGSTKTIARAAPSATPAKAANPRAASARPQRYTVKRGDTLSTIAKKHGISLNALRTANKLKSSRITAGAVLTIPGA
ncbi:MAG: LysM peptidoglycan-binding domain-containing protein [Pigmentiphaga sp.]|nr:LysM peptidoglycan-binding domain-containing protein [Pigmentiphaga sp.]